MEANPKAGMRDLKTLVRSYEREIILSALADAGGQQRHAAALLGVSPSNLHEKMKRLGIRVVRSVVEVGRSDS
jgi:DNA-binding NtrC family response regulator